MCVHVLENVCVCVWNYGCFDYSLTLSCVSPPPPHFLRLSLALPLLFLLSSSLQTHARTHTHTHTHTHAQMHTHNIYNYCVPRAPSTTTTTPPRRLRQKETKKAGKSELEVTTVRLKGHSVTLKAVWISNTVNPWFFSWELFFYFCKDMNELKASIHFFHSFHKFKLISVFDWFLTYRSNQSKFRNISFHV